jgi:GAF domain-containing protein
VDAAAGKNGPVALVRMRPGWNNQILLHWIYLPAPKPAAGRVCFLVEPGAASTGQNGFKGMTALPKDVVADLRRRVAELEQQLQSSAAERDEAIAQQAATAEILQIINSSPADLAPVFEAILDRALRPCEAQVGVFWTYDGELMHASAIRGAPPAYVEFLQRGPHRPSHVQLRLLGGTEGFVQIADLTRSDGYRNGDSLPRAAADLGGIRTLLVVPLRRHGAVLGTFGIYRQEVKPFTDRQIALVESFAAQAVIAMENARLFNETKEALERQNASADILRTIASTPGDAGRSLKQIAETSARLFGAPSVSIQLVEDGKWADAYRLGDSAQRIRAAVPLASIRVGGRNMPGAVAGENRQIHIPDLDHLDPSMSDWPGLPHARAAGTRTMCGTPLRREGKAIGALIVYRDRLLPFTPEELALAQSFADQAVIAIENARLFNETKEALERQTATAEILKVIASSPSDIQPVFDAIATRANALIGGFSSTVCRFIDEVAYLKAFTPTTPAADEILKATFPRAVADFPPFQMAQAGEVTQVPDTEALSDEIRNISRARGFRSMLFAPLMNDGVSIGFIAVTRVQPGSFADHHVQLLRTFADQAVIAIENARLFEEVQAKTRDLSESLQQQTATADVLKVISRSAFDLQAVFDTLISSAVELSGGFGGTICLREGDGYRYLATSGIEGDFKRFLVEHPPTPGRASAAGRVILSGNVESIPDVLEDPEYVVPTYELNKTRSVLGVPLLRNDKVEGALVLNRTEPGLFTARQIELVKTFADQAVIAIENVRLFDEVQAKTRELTEALTYQTGSGNILRVIASSPTDVGPVLKAIVENASELCEAYDAVVLLKDGNDLRYSAHHGPIPITLEKWPINRNWTAGRAFLDQKPVHLRDLFSDEGADFPDGRELSLQMGSPIRSILSVPLLRENESIAAPKCIRSVTSRLPCCRLSPIRP